MVKISNQKILIIIASLFCLIALFNGLPYGYFTLLRFVVCAVGTYVAYKTYESDKDSLWVWVFGGIAILFNPIIPIHLERETWTTIDLIVGIFLIISIFIPKSKNK